MKPFVCVICKGESLVRSNFKLTPDRRAYCRNETACKQRAADRDEPFSTHRAFEPTTRTCDCCHHEDYADTFKPAGQSTFVCRDERACGDRACAFETQNEYRLAQNAHNADSTPPRDTSTKVARYWSGYDMPTPTTCDKVYIDRTTGLEAMRYDAADPANTNPYYGATTDGECMTRRGHDLQEMISPSQVVITNAECQNRMSECGSDMYEYEFGL